MTSCGHHSQLPGDLTGKLNNLITALCRCHLRHLRGWPDGLRGCAGPDSSVMVRLESDTSGAAGLRRIEVDSQPQTTAAAAAHQLLWISL